MVDTENQLYPLTPLEEEDIDSPLSGEFLQDMENIQDLSQSLGDDSSGALSLTEFQSLGNGPGSDGSVITGKRVWFNIKLSFINRMVETKNFFNAIIIVYDEVTLEIFKLIMAWF